MGKLGGKTSAAVSFPVINGQNPGFFIKLTFDIVIFSFHDETVDDVLVFFFT